MTNNHIDDALPLESYFPDLKRASAQVVALKPKRRKAKASPSSVEWPEWSQSGPRKRSVANFRAAAAEAGITFRYNVMTLAIEIKLGANASWEPMTDAAQNAEWLRITEHGCDMPEAFWLACARDEAHRNQFDPATLWLNSLQWDGAPRLDDLFIRHGNAAGTPLIRAMTRAFFVGAIRRLRQPGAKFDTVLVLEGAQGLGKSSAIAVLSPFPEWFSDSLEVGADPKHVIEQTRGRWLVELAEMSGMGRREVERVKAFCSRQVDSARLAYARQSIDVPRRFVLIATTNPDASGQYLGDGTGNRRWWPIALKAHIDREALRGEAPQIWAEAAHLEAEGEPEYLTREMDALAAEAQRERLVDDPWCDVLAPLAACGRSFIPVREAWEKLGMEAAKRDGRLGQRIANCMRQLGYEKRKERFGGKPELGFVPIPATCAGGSENA